jgi:hypothetical protein
VAEVSLHRDQEAPVSGPDVGDEKIPLLFAPMMGHDSASLQIVSIAGLLPGGGFRIASGSSKLAEVLPITFDVPSWDDLLNNIGNDDYSYDPVTGAVSPGSDGILEINMYPITAPPGSPSGWTPGNRGTVDLGDPNNSTSDLERQIVDGLNADDLSFFGGEISFDNGPFDVNGDTGISAGVKDELTSIIGLPRAIPLFSTVTAQGNTTQYTIVKFVGIRIMAVKLTGGNKYVIAQPALVIDDTVVPGTGTVVDSTFFLHQ